ncbi:MAG: hypothetical protein U5L96_09705 [Owenweeksia sp.]|nr:hypothetical protein [Owenweeksia sp.]
MYDPFDAHKSLHVKNLQLEPLLSEVMTNGKRTAKPQSLKEIARFSQKKLDGLPQEYKRFENPHIYKVGISTKLRELRNQLINEHKQQSL